MTQKTRTPAVEGWFTLDESDPRLLGTRCTKCENLFFPREETFCPESVLPPGPSSKK